MNQPRMERRHPELTPSEIEISETASFGCDVKIDKTGNLSIGAGSHLAHQVSVVTHTHSNITGPIRNGKVGPAVKCTLKIGKNVFVGEHAVILPQAKSIGDWAVIGAYSVLTKPVGAGEIWAGNPAKFIRYRDEWPHAPIQTKTVNQQETKLHIETQGLDALEAVLHKILQTSREENTQRSAKQALAILQQSFFSSAQLSLPETSDNEHAFIA